MAKTQREQYAEAVYELKAAGTPWAAVYEAFPDVPAATLRKFNHEERKRRGVLDERARPPVARADGVTADEEELDEDAIWAAAIAASQQRRAREQRRQAQCVEFDHGPVGIALMADLHLGSAGVDYERLDADIETIVQTPGMYVMLVGDILDNWIIGKLMRLMMGEEFTIDEQWALARHVLRRLAPKLIASVSGNHDLWTYGLTHVDHLRDTHARLTAGVLYHRYELPLTVQVGGAEHVFRIRHKWKGSSIYNPTHAIERAALFDKGRHFDIGVAAHTHVSALVRQFNNGGQTGIAAQCGSYKVFDEYAEAQGFPLPNEGAAVVVVLDEDGSRWGTNELASAARYLQRVYLN